MIIKKWSIYRANLDPTVGSEQGKSRPVLVISEDAINDVLNIVNVIPITSKKEGRTIYPNEVLIPANNNFLRADAFTAPAMDRQIETPIDTDYVDLKTQKDISSDGTAIGFIYNIGYESTIKIAYSKRNKKTVICFASD
jgi:mRNA interferase MazF